MKDIHFLSGTFGANFTERPIRLTNPTEWKCAVRAGEISPDSMVVIEHGADTEAVYAGGIEALAAYFQAPKLTPVKAAECAPLANSTPVVEPVRAREPIL